MFTLPTYVWKTAYMRGMGDSHTGKTFLSELYNFINVITIKDYYKYKQRK